MPSGQAPAACCCRRRFGALRQGSHSQVVAAFEDVVEGDVQRATAALDALCRLAHHRALRGRRKQDLLSVRQQSALRRKCILRQQQGLMFETRCTDARTESPVISTAAHWEMGR